MRKKKVETQLEITPPTGVFKLKFTNLRKTAYPDAPTKGDLDGFQVGDLLTRRTMGTIFEVLQVKRDVITAEQIRKWEIHNQKTNYRNGSTIEVISQEVKKLLEDYEKNGNFGAIVYVVKALFRGGKPVAKGKLIKFYELDNQKSITWNNYTIVDIPVSINTIGRQAMALEYQLNRVKANMDNKKALLDMFNKLTQKKLLSTPIILESGEELLPTALL